MGSFGYVEPDYAAAQVARIDAELSEIAARKKELEARRKMFAPHVPKKK